jgi:hypothetical protein
VGCADLDKEPGRTDGWIATYWATPLADGGRTELNPDVEVAPVMNGDGLQNGLAKLA